MGDSWTVLGPVDVMRYDSTRVLADKSGEVDSKLGPLLFCRRFCSEERTRAHKRLVLAP